jgi:hypothetical protein
MTRPESPRCPDCHRVIHIRGDGTIDWHWPVRGNEPCIASGRRYITPADPDDPQ